MAESAELRHKANRDLELALPSSETVMKECQQLRMSLDAEVASHLRTKQALADMTLSRQQSDEVSSAAAVSGIKRQQIELASLRETNFDLSEQVQVRQFVLLLCCIVLYCIVLYCIVLYCIVLYCIVLYCIVLHCISQYSIM